SVRRMHDGSVVKARAASFPPPRNPGLPGLLIKLRKSGKPDLRWGRDREGVNYEHRTRAYPPPHPSPSRSRVYPTLTTQYGSEHRQAGGPMGEGADRVRSAIVRYLTNSPRKIRFAAIAAATALSAVAPAGALAQQPGRPITIIVPYSPGTGIDILARALGNQLSPKRGRAAAVHKKAGPRRKIATGARARAAPDGNTLLMIAKVFVVNPSVFENVPYDPIRSFAPIIKLATGSIVLAVHPSVPADSTQSFIQYAKSRPGEINYGSPGFATP